MPAAAGTTPMGACWWFFCSSTQIQRNTRTIDTRFGYPHFVSRFGRQDGDFDSFAHQLPTDRRAAGPTQMTS
jgi:hypothetical protein